MMLDSLPNELLSSVLGLFPTKELVAFVPVNSRFHSLILRILHRRLVDTASRTDYELILECYHPSAKISTPTLSCRYLGSKTADGLPINEESPKAADLPRMYSSFQPVVREENNGRVMRPWGGTFPSRAEGVLSVDSDEVATEEVFLDDSEPFSQLCATTSVVRPGPRRGLFVSHINISDGVVRVWRNWLGQMSDRHGNPNPERPVCEDEDILWVDPGKEVGLRFRIKPGPAERMPVISGPNDEPPISFTLIYDELLVRTSKLLLAMERSMSEEISHSGKAVIIAGL